ncbi:hypothetical protein [Gorillibacterium sp. sgz5001074]|uniref:hypothetical protein n=1 Tax=Gorillibacterium sp. sgz5001074 TaxID=3446695 RepID=UPI003F676EE3
MLVLSDLEKLYRDKRKVFYGVFSLGVIGSWGIKSLNSKQVTETVIVCFTKIIEREHKLYELIEPQLVSCIPHGGSEEQYVVLFMEKGNYLPLFIEQVLLSIIPFEQIIDKNTKSSKNSTKTLKRHSLEETILRVFNKHHEQEEWSKLADCLTEYITELINRYPSLGYLPVAERIRYREKYVGDQSFAWEMYLRYFYDKWLTGVYSNIAIPDLNKNYSNSIWEGNFFDRGNPLWSTYLGGNAKFSISPTQRLEIYSIWKQLID